MHTPDGSTCFIAIGQDSRNCRHFKNKFLETYSVLLASKGVYHMKFERGFEHFSLDMDLDMDAVNVIDFNRDN